MPKIKNVAIVDLKDSGENPRQMFDKDALAELQESIKANGLHTPPTVSKNGEGYTVIDGHRRLICLKKLGVDRVDVFIQEVGEEQAREMRLTINLQREGIHPLDEAAGYAKLQRQYKYTIKGLALRLGKPEGYIAQRLQLNQLCEAGRKAFIAGKITVTNAIQISRLYPQSRQAEVLKEVNDRWRTPTPAEISEMVKEKFMLALKDAPFDPKEDGLSHTPPCTNCGKRSGNDRLLFADLAKMDVCSDAACFKAKAGAHMRAAFKKAKGQPGIEVLDPKKHKVYGSYGRINDGHVELTDTCYADQGRRTYAQLLAAYKREKPEDEVTVYLTGTQQNHLRKVIKTKDAEKIWRSMSKTASNKLSPQEKAARRKMLDNRKRDKMVFSMAAERMVAAGEKNPLAGKFLLVIAEANIKRTWDDVQKTVIARRGLEVVKVKRWSGAQPTANNEATLLKAAAGMDAKQLTGLMVELALGDNLDNSKLLGVSMKDVEAAVDRKIKLEKAEKEARVSKPKSKVKKKVNPKGAKQ